MEGVLLMHFRNHNTWENIQQPYEQAGLARLEQGGRLVDGALRGGGGYEGSFILKRARGLTVDKFLTPSLKFIRPSIASP